MASGLHEHLERSQRRPFLEQKQGFAGLELAAEISGSIGECFCVQCSEHKRILLAHKRIPLAKQCNRAKDKKQEAHFQPLFGVTSSVPNANRRKTEAQTVYRQQNTQETENKTEVEIMTQSSDTQKQLLTR